MKLAGSTFVFLIGFAMLAFAQVEDQNSRVIQQYFEQIHTAPLPVEASALAVQPNSLVQLKQVGDLNSIVVNALQAGDNLTVNQIGKRNSYAYYCSYNLENIQLTVHQEGELNSLQIYGENSLMKNAIIRQKSNFQELIIRNYSHQF